MVMAARWRPKNRRQILQLDDEGSQSPCDDLPHAAAVSLPSTSSQPANKLHALLGHYNSDDDSSSSEEKESADAEFKDFMKEIKSAEVTNPPAPVVSSVWQELWDPQSGMPYYWHTITNELTWDKPLELLKPPPQEKKILTVQKPLEPAIVKETVKSASELPSVVKPLAETSTPTLTTTIAVENTNTSGLLQRKEEKISFKFLPPDKSAAVVNAIKNINADLTPHAKTNGRLTIDADSIIAAIEKEIPPDYNTDAFVPLFQRRKPDPESTVNRPKLGNNFKTYFRSTHHQPILDDPELNSDEVLTVVNTHRGFGYQEKAENIATTLITTAEVKPTIKFIQGETLVPMVVPAAPLTLSEKISLLETKFKEDESSSESTKQSILFAAQLQVLKDAWNRKKLEADYLDEWVEATLAKLTEEKETPALIAPPGTEEEDQVIDMVLEDSGSEESLAESAPAKVAVVGAELDSALDSFYSDLANLEAPIDDVDSRPVEVTTEKSADPLPVPTVSETVAVEEDSITSDPVNKGVKRSKMSSDMSSLVAKWQKINNQSKT